jgi:lysozyme
MGAMLKKIKIWAAAACVGTVVFILPGSLFYNGILHFNNPSKEDYPVRGVDVARYQGDIEWETLARQNVSFAYIKATEGSSHTDPYFARNLDGILQTGLYAGAYHFFSFESSGASQAAHFIETVPNNSRLLPPVVDFEFYGDKRKNPPDRAKAVEELSAMLSILAEHYGKTPVIYVTKDTYAKYIAGGFKEYPIWYRDVFRTPLLSDEREWTFWQFSNRHRLKGYTGKEKFIDMNVFRGTWGEFREFAR